MKEVRKAKQNKTKIGTRARTLRIFFSGYGTTHKTIQIEVVALFLSLL